LTEKLIITVALTGSGPRKSVNPNLPEQPNEIAQDAYDCYNEGAAIVHIHARDLQGEPTGNPLILSKIHQLIRKKCNLILADTTGAGAQLTENERISCLDVDPKPEMASLNMGTLLRTFGPYKEVPFSNSTTTIERFAKEMLKRAIKPEMEVYNCAMFREVKNLIDKGLVRKPYYVNLVLGMHYQGAIEASPKHLTYLTDFIPPETICNVTAIGKMQLPLTTIAMVMGKMVRVGMEDNIYYRKSELAKSNAQLVARTVRIARELELGIASPEEARKILGLVAL
jgi:3-keto-5-aminohexanoate cleavage enzyme